MKREIGWLAVITMQFCGVVKFIPRIVFGGALSLLASAVWGN